MVSNPVDWLSLCSNIFYIFVLLYLAKFQFTAELSQEESDDVLFKEVCISGPFCGATFGWNILKFEWFDFNSSFL